MRWPGRKPAQAELGRHVRPGRSLPTRRHLVISANHPEVISANQWVTDSRHQTVTTKGSPNEHHPHRPVAAMSRGKRGKARQDSVMAGIAAGITTRRADRQRSAHAVDRRQMDLIIEAERERRTRRGQSRLWVITEAEADRLRESHRASPLETFTVGEWTP